MTLSKSIKTPPPSNTIIWGIKNDRILSFNTPPIMAVLNYSSSSFIPSTVTHSDKEAVDLCKTLLNEGADIIDIGVQTTKPYFIPLKTEEETRRVASVLDAIHSDPQCKDTIISVDTFNATTATIALQKNCSIINDISGLQLDPELIDVIQHYKPGYVLTHFTRGKNSVKKNRSSYPSNDIFLEIKQYFSNKIELLLKKGLPEHNIILDLGIGFGKNIKDTLTLLRSIENIASLGRPLLLGLSYKTFYQEEKNTSFEEKENATQVITALLASKCFCIHRVHNVKKTKQTLTLTTLFT